MAAIDSQGTTITVGDGAAGTATIGGHISYSLSDGTAADIDITTLASTAKEYRQGLQDYGDFTIELIRDLDDAGQAELLEMKAAQATREFVITFGSGTLNIGTFQGYVKSLDLNGSIDEVNKGTATIKISGAVVWS